MQKFLFTLAILSFLTGALTAEAGCHEKSKNRIYLSFMASAISPFYVETTSPTLSPAEVRSCWGAGPSLSVGYDVHSWRLEGEISYGKNKTNNIIIDSPDYPGGKVSGYYDMWSTTVNLYYDILNCTKLSPYVGVGAGIMQFSSVDVVLKDDPPTYGCSNIFTWNLMAGITYPLSPAWHIFFGYRYTGAGEQNFKTGPAILKANSLQLNNLQTGVKYYF